MAETETLKRPIDETEDTKETTETTNGAATTVCTSCSTALCGCEFAKFVDIAKCKFLSNENFVTHIENDKIFLTMLYLGFEYISINKHLKVYIFRL